MQSLASRWLYTDDRPEPQMLDALGRLCCMLGYHFHVVLADTLGARGAECLRNSTGVEAREGGVLLTVICVILGERGAEMLRHSTGVDAKALGRLLTVICVKEREQIWRREEE